MTIHEIASIVFESELAGSILEGLVIVCFAFPTTSPFTILAISCIVLIWLLLVEIMSYTIFL